jgi:schlafen family protein
VLFPKTLAEITSADVRHFALRFSEGLRVEYKSAMTDSVRQKIPAIISSFANSYGGVLVIGITTSQGAAVEPVEGYTTPDREELSLSIQNSCIENVNPPLFPRTRQIPSDISGKSFLVVEMDASAEAPHAIENSRKVYVRTGDSSRSYDIADIDVIARLIQRRALIAQRKIEMSNDQEMFASRYFNLRDNPLLVTAITPPYPDAPITEREQVYGHLSAIPGSRGNAFRMPDGGCLLKSEERRITEVWKWSLHGYLFTASMLRFTAGNNIPGASIELIRAGDVFPFVWIATDLRKIFGQAAAFFATHRFEGPIEVSVKLMNVDGRKFTGGDHFLNQTLSCIANNVPALATINASELNGINCLLDIVYQLIWPFFGDDRIATRDQMKHFLERLLIHE